MGATIRNRRDASSWQRQFDPKAGDRVAFLLVYIREAHPTVDEVDDAVNEAYAAWPTRLYLIDTDGRVVYHGGPGPFGFHPRQFGEAIERLLAVPS
jgi:hypothetical protein